MSAGPMLRRGICWMPPYHRRRHRREREIVTRQLYHLGSSRRIVQYDARPSSAGEPKRKQEPGVIRITM